MYLRQIPSGKKASFQLMVSGCQFMVSVLSKVIGKQSAVEPKDPVGQWKAHYFKHILLIIDW